MILSMTFLPAGQCEHRPSDRGWIANNLSVEPPVVWCAECREYIEMDVEHALKFWHNHALESVFEHRVKVKLSVEHPDWSDPFLDSEWEKWKLANWDEILKRVANQPRPKFQQLLTPH